MRSRELLCASFSHWKSRCEEVKSTLTRVVRFVRKNRRGCLHLAMRTWHQAVKRTAKMGRALRSVFAKARRKQLRWLLSQTLKTTAALLRIRVARLPFEIEANFASELESRIKVMKSDFEMERRQYMAQRNALIEKQIALRKAYSVHAGRIFDSLSQ